MNLTPKITRTYDIIDGRTVANQCIERLGPFFATHPACLAVVQVGDNPASTVYIGHKGKICRKLSVEFRHMRVSEDVALDQILQILDSLNEDAEVTGYIIQMPLPEHLMAHINAITERIDPAKDVDCFHPENFGRMALNRPCFYPATPYGIVTLLQHYGIETTGKCCVILGKSNIVGKPAMLMMAEEMLMGATVICCDRNTINMEQYLPLADILIVATGVPKLIKDPDLLKQGVVLIDVGITRMTDENGKTRLIGDIDLELVGHKAAYATPVPGGVGPMTVYSLMKNLALAAEH